MSFSDEWEKESKAAIKVLEETIAVTSITLFNGVIDASPVGNPVLWQNPAPLGYVGGSFRSNWYLSKSQKSSKYDENRIESKARIKAEIKRDIKNSYSDTWTLTNNAPYGPALDKGWSTQAPLGILTPNIKRAEAKIPKIYKAALKKYGVE